MRIKLAHCKQTDSRRRNRTQQEDENGSCKETRMRLLQLTLNHKASMLQERLNMFCGTNTRMKSTIVIVVVMRRRGVQRSEARGRGVGRWHLRFRKYADWLSTREREGCIFRFFHLETRFQKSAFSGAAFSGSVWTVSQNDAKHVRFSNRAFSCGRPLSECMWGTK